MMRIARNHRFGIGTHEAGCHDPGVNPGCLRSTLLLLFGLSIALAIQAAAARAPQHPLAHRRGHEPEPRLLRRCRSAHAATRCVRHRSGALHARLCHRTGLFAVALVPHHRDVRHFARHATVAVAVPGARRVRPVHRAAARGGLPLREQRQDRLQPARRSGLHPRRVG